MSANPLGRTFSSASTTGTALDATAPGKYMQVNGELWFGTSTSVYVA